MKKQLLYVLSGLLLFYGQAMAQSKSVTGKVMDVLNNQPLAGVSITIPGTVTGTTTDSAGLFQLQVPASAKVIQVSLINYLTQTIEINGGPMSILLTAAAKGLDEVVVVGYGTQKKKDLTGAVSTIGAKDIGGRQTIQVSEALQGSIAGVSVTRSSGAPGAGASILIRGITTLGANNPLIILDGVPVSNIDNVNPNDVENITVLKDAASAAIYGSRGAAGVVLVTTKRARNGQSSLEYNYEYGVQKATALPEYADAPDYMRYFNEQATNDGASTGPYPIAFINNFADSNRLYPDKFPFSNTNWQKTIMTEKYAPRYRHDLVFTMGTGKIKTKASLGYSRSDAFYDHYSYERYLFRINNDLQINNKLSANLDVAYKRTHTESPIGNPIYESRVMPAIYDDYYANGNYALAKDGRNPIAQLNEGGTAKTYLNQITGRLVFNFKPIQDLTLTALLSPTFDLDKSKTFSKRIPFTNPDGSPSAFSNQARSILTEGRTDNLAITGQLLADYTKDFKGGHSLGILGGYEELYNFNESLGASRSGFALTDFPYLNAGSQELRDNSGSASESALRSFFGRVKYDFNSKYYIQGNLRYDKSSRFGKQFRDALFPSVSAGWAVSEESFMKDLNWLSYLKLRGSYGEVGNERIGNYPYQATISFTNALFYQNGVVVPLNGGAQVDYAVENISWETTRTIDVGVDAAFLKNRLTVTADYYQKRTYDILLALDIPLYLGYEKPSQNAGTLDVKGWELEVGWKDHVGKLNYSVAFNIADARSTIIDMKGTQLLGAQSTFKGSEFNEWFGYRSNGLYQSAADTAGSPKLNSNVSPGDVRYVDINKDGKITPDDKQLLGGSLPRYLYGGNIRADYKGFDIGLSFQGIGKKLTRLSGEIVQPFAEAFGNVPQEIAGKFWSKSNTPEQNLQARYPRLSTRSISNNYEMSDFWLVNGAYFRIKNLTLGYTLKQELVKKAGIQSLRFYVSANDLFAIHHFPNYWDPEAGTSSYPIVTTIMAGATVRF
ncbi:TonB-dependent receptor [Paraflavitalea soli]|uniref:TonB-dependent receptor n=1 Tax=Paraflavitalea soli TaxID=2315862 RepID=A0A3B7MHK8_9BACT|nr:TonB-dependent receptor [Paraflavitalea soli]AXY73894.1 TonB-dependent receptor [Paraflavitalea soli]